MLPGLCALVLSSCFETREEVWLYSDASGRAQLHAKVPLAATRFHGGEPGIRKLIEDFLDQTPAFTSYQLDTKVDSKELQIDLRITFDDALEFSKVSRGDGVGKLPAAAAEFFGSTTVNFSGLHLDFHRHLDLGKAIPGSSFIPRSRLEDRHITTILHLPKPARSQNASEVRNDGHTLVWETPLATAMREPIDIRFSMPLPLPWPRIIGVAVFLLILSMLLVCYVRRGRKRRARAAVTVAAFPVH